MRLVRPQAHGVATALVHAGFVLTGVMTTQLGPMLPVLSARWSLNDQQAGYLFTAQFASSMLGVGLSSVLMPRWGYRWTLLLGVGFMGLGAGLLAESGWLIGVVSVCVYGAGFGLAIPTSNLLISELNPGARAAALNLLNFSWGIGAVGCPFIVAALQRSHRTPLFLYGTAGLLGVLALGLSGVRFPADLKKTQPPAALAATSAWKSRLIPILGALFFVYVGTENAVGGWIASYARRIETGSGAFWAMTPSFFWGALLTGRALAPAILKRLRETTVASAGLALAAIGVMVLLAGHTMTPIVVGASLTGLGLSSVFPINIAMLSHWFGEMATRVSGLMFALAALGGATLPLLVGALSNRFGSLRLGLTVPFFGSALMLALYVANRNATNPATV